MATLLDQVKGAIEASGESRRQIALRAGVAESGLSRLMSGERGMGAETVERLADALELEIIVRPKRRQKVKRKGR